MKKRLLSFVLIFVMAIGFVPNFAFAEAYGDLTYKISGGKASITNCKDTATSVEIPSEISGYPVTSIGNFAFNGCSSLTQVTIPDSVTSIGNYAFDGCNSLKKVYITDIEAWCNISFGIYSSNPLRNGADLYLNGEFLTNLVIPDSVTSIGDFAFAGCSLLSQVTIPGSVTSIGSSAFERCKSLAQVTIPDSVTSIGNYAFCGCSSLTKVTIPNSVTSIGNYAFSGCSSLTQVTIPDSVTSIGKGAFYGCSSLTQITIPDSVTSIGDLAFCDCSSLMQVTIPNSVTSIGDYAFGGCSSLTQVTIPDSVTSIGESAFSSCYSLKKVYITDIEAWCNISFGNYSSNPLWHGEDLYLNSVLLTNLVIPDSVTSIGNYAFEYCSSLTQVTIPGSVTSIGSSAFRNCSSIRKFGFSDKMTMAEGYVLASSGVKVVYIPKEITLIKNSAFKDTNINYVYYGGSEQDKQNLTILPNNDSLNTATWVYNAEGLPDCQYDNACDTTCNVCQSTRKITHKYGEYTYNYDATCYKDGTKTRVCSVCEKEETVTAKGTKLINSSKTFKDVPANAWYKKFVDFAVTNGIFKGTSDKTFSPEQNMTRAQFVMVFANLSGIDTSNNNVKSGFKDVPKGKWYTAAVTWAAKNNIVSGVGDGKFDPEAKVTREQMCVMLVNYIEKYQKKELKVTTNAPKFADDKNISSWAKTAVYKCAKAGLVNGVGNNKFDPGAFATRAQGATIFTSFYKEYMV